MERLPGGQFFPTVEGRLKDGANQYRAITAPFDGETYREWSVSWGMDEKDLFDHEIALLRAGFKRQQSQIFTDSSGVALHQLVMLLPMSAEDSQIPSIAKYGAGIGDLTGSPSYPPVNEPAHPVEPEPEPDFTGPEVAMIEELEAPKPEVELLSELDLEIERSPSAPSAAIAAVIAANTTSPPAIPVPPEPAETVDPLEAAGPPVAEVVEEPEPEVIEPEPEPEPKTINYKVVSGDSLSRIARRYKVSISEIKKANGLTSDTIRLKQILKIPQE